MEEMGTRRSAAAAEAAPSGAGDVPGFFSVLPSPSWSVSSEIEKHYWSVISERLNQS